MKVAGWSLAWRPGRASGLRCQPYDGPLVKWALGVGPLELRRHHGAADGLLWRFRRRVSSALPIAFEYVIWTGFYGLLAGAAAWLAALTLRATLSTDLSGDAWPLFVALAGWLLGGVYGAVERRRCCS